MKYIIVRKFSDDLEHHGIKGQHWGNRRWQNEDGSLTPAGYEHYGVGKNLKSSYKNEMNKLKSLQRHADMMQNRMADSNKYFSAERSSRYGAYSYNTYSNRTALKKQLKSSARKSYSDKRVVNQVNKMLKMFANTPYEKVIRKYASSTITD